MTRSSQELTAFPCGPLAVSAAFTATLPNITCVNNENQLNTVFTTLRVNHIIQGITIKKNAEGGALGSFST